MFFNIKNFKKLSFGITLILFAILTINIATVMAQEKTKKSQSLELEAFQITDNLNKENQRVTIIEFVFSKNVVNMEVSENNRECFKVINKEDGSEISFEVEMADDQIEREKRNNIILVIKDGIESLKTYQIIISPELESKSGDKLEEELVLEFLALGIVK